ncbi:MAG: S41 family peptidase [Lachnospiraceae bacterium]|nr:S41 family peptidase [Lachnospiraceae bacterium]
MQEERKSNKFLPGFFAGILVTLGICFVVVGVFFIITINSSKLSMLHTGAIPGTGSTEEVDSIDWDEVSKKSQTIAEMLNQVYMGDIDPDAMEQNIYKGIFSSLNDPYTVYYTPEEYAKMMESDSGVYCGAGVLVTQLSDSNLVQIVRVYDGSGAKDAGMQPGDVIVKVNDEDVTALDLNSVVALIRGEEGTWVKVTIYRESEKKYIDCNLQRRVVTAESVDYKMLDDGVGYISVSQFDEPTDEQFIAAVEKLLKEGMTSLVIDMRDNPGGLVDVAVKMLDRLLPKGVITYTEDKYGNRSPYNSDATELNIPMAVLINGNSASASEIFAGALRDYDKAVLVGTKSFGKGIVQTVIPLDDGSGIKITFAKYFSPKGTNIHGSGFEPDVEVKMSEEEYRSFRLNSLDPKDDTVLQEAIKNLRK